MEEMSETRDGRIAQLEKHEEKGRGWANGLRKFVENCKFEHCCARGRAHFGIWATRPYLVSYSKGFSYVNVQAR